VTVFATVIAFAAFLLGLYNFIQQEISRVKNKPRLEVRVQTATMASRNDDYVSRTAVHVTVWARGGKVGLEEVTFDWMDDRPQSGWGFSPVENENVATEPRPFGHPFKMRGVLNEFEPATWRLRIARPQGNKNGVDGEYTLRAVAVTLSGKKYFSEPFRIRPDMTTDDNGNVILAT
jgi:hypothetical protein